jgi:hypothetical protein
VKGRSPPIAVSNETKWLVRVGRPPPGHCHRPCRPELRRRWPRDWCR